jgi:hypothetical protein
MYWRWHASPKTATYDTLHLTALRIASTLIESLDNRQLEIQAVADLMGSSHFSDTTQIGPLFDRMLIRQPNYAWIGLASAEGKVIAASGKMLLGVDVAKRPWFQRGMNGVSLVDPHFAQLLGIRPANPSTSNEELQAPSCPRKPSCTPCLKRFPIRLTLSPARAGSTAHNSRLN